MGTKTGLNGITFGDATVQNTAAVTGVTSAVAGTGVSVSAATGAVTFTNSGVTSLVAGTGISVSGATGAVTVSATGGGVTSAVAGNGITVSGATGAVTFSQDIYTGSTLSYTSYPIGTYMLTLNTGSGSQNVNESVSIGINPAVVQGPYITPSPYSGTNTPISGTWKRRGNVQACGATGFLVQRVS